MDEFMSAGLGRYRVIFYLSRWICPDDLGLVSRASYGSGVSFGFQLMTS